MDLNWVTLAAIVSVLGAAVAAVAWTVKLVHHFRSKKLQQQESVQAQARRVWAWVDLMNDVDDDPVDHLVATTVAVHLHNESDEPVTRVGGEVQLFDAVNRPIRIEWILPTWVDVLPPGTKRIETQLGYRGEVPRTAQFLL